MHTIVVTGAGSGIGRATAERFCRKGWRAIVTDVNEAAGQETADQIAVRGQTAVFRRADSSSIEDWNDLADWVCTDYGIPDVVVNNAGILIGGNFMEQTGDDWRRMIQINMMGPLFGSRTFVERMTSAGRQGHIVNVASCGAFLPTSVAPSYVTAKAGVYFGTQALRSEFGRQGIGVSAVCPGLIKTKLAANSHRAGDDGGWSDKLASGHKHFGRSPERVAAAIDRAVRWNLGTVPVGTEAWLAWFLYRLSPSLVQQSSRLATMSLADKAVDLSGSVFGGQR